MFPVMLRGKSDQNKVSLYWHSPADPVGEACEDVHVGAGSQHGHLHVGEPRVLAGQELGR